MRWILGVMLTLGAWPAMADTARDVRVLFERSCYGCHGKPPNRPEAGLNILDVKTMRDTGLITPGGAEFSLPYTYIDAERMPPIGQKFPDGTVPQRLTVEEKAKVKQWITEGASDFAPDIGPYVPTYTYAQQLQFIRKDLDSAPREQRANIRYISLAHIAYQELDGIGKSVFVQAIEKTVNSLSVADHIVRLQPIEAKGLIYRVVLSDVRWTSGTWRFIDAANPFTASLAANAESRALETGITKDLGSTTPFIRAEWFVTDAMRPPLYHNVLYLDQIGAGAERQALKQLEEWLGIERLSNITNGRILRAAFTNSGVSQNNRLIERHDIGSYPGAYWLSYDFASNAQDPALRRNLFTFPLGPQDAFPNDTRSFLHAGGEVIFSLPNGLHAYLLVDSTGKRLDKAPTTIVADPTRPDHAVENGISCFRCHEHGMILKNDTLAEFIQANKDLFQDLVPVLSELYRDKELIAQSQRTDLQAYLTAMKSLNIGPRDTEPVTFVRQYFEQDVTLDRLAAEVDLPAVTVRQKIATSPVLRSLVGPLLVSEGRVKREVIVSNFAVLIHILLGV